MQTLPSHRHIENLIGRYAELALQPIAVGRYADEFRRDDGSGASTPGGSPSS